MKKLILIVSIVALIFLTGCGIFSLDSWVCPDDSEFLALIEELDTPQKTCQYIEDNFKYEFNRGLLTPYELYTIEKGNCDDFSGFGRYIANYHGYETYWIWIFFTTGNTSHVIAIYVEDEKYNYSTNGKYYPIQEDNFRDCVIDYFLYHTKKELSRYNVYNYENVKIEEGIRR